MAKVAKKAEVAPEAVTTPTATPVEPVQLTINDLQTMAKIIDLSSRRGAFQAAELSQVGETYNKLAGFLAYVEQEQAKEAAEAATPAPAAEAAV